MVFRRAHGPLGGACDGLDRAQCAEAKARGCVYYAAKRLCYAADKGGSSGTDGYDKTDYDETDHLIVHDLMVRYI